MAPEGQTEGWTDMDKSISLRLQRGIMTIQTLTTSYRGKLTLTDDNGLQSAVSQPDAGRAEHQIRWSFDDNSNNFSNFSAKTC